MPIAPQQQFRAVQPAQTAMLLHSGQMTQPQRIPLVVNRATNVATIDMAYIHLQNPNFRPPPLPGQIRATFDLPTLVSPAAVATLDMLFEAPRDPAKRFFLSHYGIAVAPGTGPRAQWVTLESTANGCRLTVHLADITPPTLSSGNARVTPSTVRYLITTSLQGRAVSWDLSPIASPAGVELTLVLELGDFASRDLLYAAMTDLSAETKLIVRSQMDLALPVYPQPQPYTRASAAVDVTIPFVFSKDLDANVFAGLHGASGALPAWNICAVDWDGRRYTYYQATNQPTQVYFLPDAFKVGRQTRLPRRPALTVSANGTDMASMQMTLSYLAAPVWDPQRIAAAGPELQNLLALTAPPSLALFQATDTSLLLNLPGADPAMGATLTEQRDALIDLTAGVQGSVTMGVAPFRQVYNALFDSGSALLSGEVRVTVGTDTAHIPFIARIDDMAGAILDINSSVNTGTNRMNAVLRNAIESPIHIKALSGVILRGNTPIASAIVGTTPDPPAELKPAGADPNQFPADVMSVTLAPSTGQIVTQAASNVHGNLGEAVGAGVQAPGMPSINVSQVLDNSCTPLFDFSNVAVVADPKATWRAIMMDQGAGPVSRSVTLKCVAATLTKPTPQQAAQSGTNDAVLALQVVFESGQTATFDSSQTPDQAGFLNQALKLSVPIDAFILGDAPADIYRYRIDVVTASGIKQGAWVTDNRDTLFVVPG
jgi:hypothetical protein